MNGTVIRDLVEQELMKLHTGFIGKVVSVSGGLATVQPLNMVKAYGGPAQKQAVLPNCPVLDSAVKFTSLSPAAARRAQAGDIVYCACADRDISETRGGNFALPAAGHHTLAGAVVIGIL